MDDKSFDCVFCNKIDEGSVTAWGPLGVFHFEPLNPVVPGHQLFIAREHFAYPHYNPAVTGLLFNAASSYAGMLFSDYNLIVNGGRGAGQTVSHTHIHVVPRAEDDGLKMPWTDQLNGRG